MKGLIHNQRGSAMTVLLLVMIPIFIAGIMLTLEQPRMIYGSDNDLQHAVAEATRAAAMCVNETAQANGILAIDPDRAHTVFQSILSYNLGLDGSLNPVQGSGMKAPPNYVLIIYNGDNTYTPGAVEYDFINGSLASADIPFAGFPQDFAIGVDSISYGSGNKTVTLDSPGCVAVIRQSIVPVASNNATEAVRWASSTVLYRN